MDYPEPKLELGNVYRAAEIESDEARLPDSAFYLFNLNGQECVIQRSHVTREALLSVPGFAESRWVFKEITDEWIPCFRFQGSSAEFLRLVDVEPDKSPYAEPGTIWVTPKGFYRRQFHQNDHSDDQSIT